jgi:type VI secretion system protein ImpF
MARTPTEGVVTPSIIDRLIDREPKMAAEAPLSRIQSMRLLKEGLRRDLEWLLNARRIVVEPDESLGELSRSLYVYGLPDFSTYSASSARDQAKLLRVLQGAVKVFEPRLANVRILPLESSGFQALRLRIEGLLLTDLAPEHVSFDTFFEVKSGACKVKGDADAG